MTNLFTRIKESISADLHQLLDEKEQKNPITALNHYLRQSEQQKEKVQKLLQRQYRLRDEFASEYHQANDNATKRLKQAEIAKAAEEFDLYEYAMQEYEEYKLRAERLKAAREETVNQIDLLERKYKEMTHKIKDMQLKRMELMGRENVARTTQHINHVLKEEFDKPFYKFEEIERYIENLENQVNRKYFESTFDYKISQLERKLKQKQSNQADVE